MRLRVLSACLLLALFMAIPFTVPVQAATRAELLVVNYRYLPESLSVLTLIKNRNLVAVDHVTINLIIRDPKNMNKIIGLGRLVVDPNLVVKANDTFSVSVPVTQKITMDIPAQARFTFTITGAKLDQKTEANLPVFNTDDLELSQGDDANPWIIGFVNVDSLPSSMKQLKLKYAIFTFVDRKGQICWNEQVDLSSNTVAEGDSFTIGRQMPKAAGLDLYRWYVNMVFDRTKK